MRLSRLIEAGARRPNILTYNIKANSPSTTVDFTTDTGASKTYTWAEDALGDLDSVSEQHVFDTTDAVITMLLANCGDTAYIDTDVDPTQVKTITLDAGGDLEEILVRDIAGGETLADFLANAQTSCIVDFVDTDGDTIPDNLDNCPDDANTDQLNTDEDELGDACDLDDDDDTVLDVDDNCPLIPNTGQADNDQDGLGDVCDDDDDDDTVLDVDDNCPVDANTDQTDTDEDGLGDACDLDDDDDTVLDVDDNCPLHINPQQEDNENDGIGDVCDDDDDNDGVLDVDDNCQYTSNSGQEDTDGDGQGDACEDDDDNDGVLDNVDNCPLTQNPSQDDFDQDGQGDVCDDDDDNDGVLDVDDNCDFTTGSALYQGCPVADKNIVSLHTIYLGAGGATKDPLGGVEVRVFDRNDANFQAAYTKNPKGDEYAGIFENGPGQIASCVTDALGICYAGEETTGDYLVVVKYVDSNTQQIVYTGLPKSDPDFVNGLLATKEFQIIKKYNKAGTFYDYVGGRKTVVMGSQLDIIYPLDATWDEYASSYVYPFIFTSDDSWEVNVCTQVPVGYEILGVYDAYGDLLTSDNCSQTFVAGETKVIAFNVVQTGSPPEWAMNARFKVTGPNGKVHNFNLKVPSHVYEHARGIPFGDNPQHN
jgi:hypothetical protein